MTLFEGVTLATLLRRDAEVGLCGVDFRTRRRNRASAIASSLFRWPHDDCGRRGGVRHWPEYIRAARDRLTCSTSAAPRAGSRSTASTARRETPSRNAETFFIASRRAAHWGGVDISHRAGYRWASSRSTGDGTIMFPISRVLGHFNTLGNLLVQPRAGLLFPCFETGEALRLAGIVEDFLGEPGSRVAPRRRANVEVQAMPGMATATLARFGDRETDMIDGRTQGDNA